VSVPGIHGYALRAAVILMMSSAIPIPPLVVMASFVGKSRAYSLFKIQPRAPEDASGRRDADEALYSYFANS
jgi:hypothetical protein